MNENVAKLNLVHAPVFEDAVNGELVATLGKMLRDAEQGRITAIAMAAIVRDEEGDRASRTAFVAPSGADAEWMVGVIETIKHRLMVGAIKVATAPADWPRAPNPA